jgi:glycosyltransferase involved in cell wall biosynthesis
LEPVRILHITSGMDMGGIETMVMNLYRHMDRQKIQFDFVEYGDKIWYYDPEIEELGGRIYRFPAKRRGFFGRMKAYRELFDAHREYTIVHTHASSVTGTILATDRMAKTCGIPTRILHSHTSQPEHPFSVAGARHFVQKHLNNGLITDLFACSQCAGEFMYGKRAFEKRGTLIRNAIDPTRYTFSPETRRRMREAFQLDDCLVMGHVGRFDYPKNHEFLVEIFAALCRIRPDSKLLLVGIGDNMETIREKVSNLGLQDKVIFAGLRRDVADVMQAMDVFVMPSRYEGLPLVSIEAQGAGLPCIFSENVTREVSVTPNTRFCSLEESTDVWAEIILQSLDGFERQDTSALLAQAGYDIRRVAQQLQEFYLQRAERK